MASQQKMYVNLNHLIDQLKFTMGPIFEMQSTENCRQMSLETYAYTQGYPDKVFKENMVYDGTLCRSWLKPFLMSTPTYLPWATLCQSRPLHYARGDFITLSGTKNSDSVYEKVTLHWRQPVNCRDLPMSLLYQQCIVSWLYTPPPPHPTQCTQHLSMTLKCSCFYSTLLHLKRYKHCLHWCTKNM